VLPQNSRSSGNTAPEEDEDSSDCQQLEAEVAKAQAFLQECRARRKELNEEIRTLKNRVKVLEVKVPKLAMEIAGCDTTREELTKRIPELKSQSELSASDAAKLVELNRNVHKCRTEMSSCAMLASKLEAEVARLQKAILDAGGSKLKKQQAACEKALSSLNDTQKALNSAKVAITSSQKAVTKARDAKAAAEEQLDECKATLEDKHTEFKSLEDDALHVLQSYEKVKEVEAEKKDALDAVTKECEVLKKAQSEVKCVEIELLGHIEAFDKQIVDCKKKMQHWTKELSKLRAVAEEDDDDLDLSDDEEEEEDTGSDAPSPETLEGADGDTTMEDALAGDSDIAPEEPAQKLSKTSLPKLSFAVLEKYEKDVIKDEIEVLETERNTIAKNANMGAIAEYRKKEADYLIRYVTL
jgi:structural maintenance of chromosome 4